MIFKENQTPAEQPANPVELKEAYQGVVVDSRYHDLRSLLLHTAGYRWVLPEYYSAWLGKDDAVQGFDTETPGAFQQYRCIRNLEIRVTDPLAPSQDPKSKEFEYVGGATGYHGFIPNEKDVFVADVGDGRSALFEVTEVEKMMITRDGLYSFRYKLLEFINEERHANLKAKVVLEVFFVKDFVKYGKNPLLVSEELEQLNELRRSVDVLADEYFDSFYNHDKATLLLPDQQESAYDPFLLSFVRAVIPESAVERYRAIKTLNTDGGSEFKYTTLWDALLNREERELDFAQSKLILRNIRFKRWLHYYGSIHYSGIVNIVYPSVDLSIGREATSEFSPSAPREFARPVDLNVVLKDDLTGLPIMSETVPPMIYPVTQDDNYVFTQAFYHQKFEDMSVLEYLASSLLRADISTNIPLLLKAVGVSRYWGQVERFYYIPVLILLCHAAMREVN